MEDLTIEDYKVLLEQKELKLFEVRAELAEAKEALLRCISALSWLPPDSGPLRKQAGEAIACARKVINETSSADKVQVVLEGLAHRALRPDQAAIAAAHRELRKDVRDTQQQHIEKLETELAEAREEIINYRIEAKRLVDSTLGLELTSDNRKLKSARASLQRYLSTPSSADKVQAVLDAVGLLESLVPNDLSQPSLAYAESVRNVCRLYRALREKG